MALAFHDVQFGAGLSYGFKGGPGFRTRIVEHTSGHEQRVIEWSAARARYEVGHLIKTRAQLAALLDFFNARRGQAYGFRFKDWSDYQASQDGATYQSIGTGDGADTTFQLIKTYSDSGGSYVRTINKPVNNGSMRVKVAGVLQTEGVGGAGFYTVNYATGIVTFGAAPAGAAALTAYYEFDVPCRFATDEFQNTITAFDNNDWTPIPIIEIRV